MRKFSTIIILTLITITLFIAASCSNQRKTTEVYSFSGESDNIAINNGIIIVTDEEEKFIGGDLTFKGEQLSGVKNSSAKFYYIRNGEETSIQNIFESVSGADEGMEIGRDTGTSSSKDLFFGDDLEQIKQSLNFTLSGELISGEIFEYSVTLDVKKVY